MAQPVPVKASFSVNITNLTPGDTFLCPGAVLLNWEKPNPTDVARVKIFCNCSQHGGEVASYATPNGSTDPTSGKRPITINHNTSPPVNQPGRTIYAIIEDGNGVEKDRSEVSGVKVQCPPLPSEDEFLKAAVAVAAATGHPITVDGPDDPIVQLTAGADKVLCGTFDKRYGSKIAVFVNEVVGDVQILRFVDVTRYWFSTRWSVRLPSRLWANRGDLRVRLAFVSKTGILGYARTLPTQIT